VIKAAKDLGITLSLPPSVAADLVAAQTAAAARASRGAAADAAASVSADDSSGSGRSKPRNGGCHHRNLEHYTAPRQYARLPYAHFFMLIIC
jgi:hypothetical protein